MPTQKKTLSLPTQRRLARRKQYVGSALAERLNQLLTARNETYREATQKAGLDHQSFGRILRSNMRPTIQTCILLADHFEINPNELLLLAGYPPLKVFDIHTANAENLPPEAVDVAMDLARIANPGTRKAVAGAIRTLLKKYFEP
jgi:transcriptional regulator with XRE-family HTH domain